MRSIDAIGGTFSLTRLSKQEPLMVHNLISSSLSHALEALDSAATKKSRPYPGAKLQSLLGNPSSVVIKCLRSHA